MIVRRRTTRYTALAAVAGLAMLALASGCGRSEQETEFGDPGAEYEATHFTANPEAKPYYGPTPFTVQFSTEPKNAKGSVKFLWEFKDGSPQSTEQSPVHTFTKPGLYTVGLQATDSTGEVDGGAVIVRAMTDEEVKAVEAKKNAVAVPQQ